MNRPENAPQVVNGYPWQGQEFNTPMSLQMTRGLGGAILRAAAEAGSHPGLYAARYNDITSPWLSARPAPIVPPARAASWRRLIAPGVSDA